MTEQEVSTAITQAINAIQQLSGNPVIPVDPLVKPIGDLPGFDSLLGLEATLELEQAVGELPWQNAFVNAENTRALTFTEVVARIVALGNSRS